MDSWQSSQGEASQQDSNLRVSLMWHHSALSSSLPGLAPSLPRRQSPPKAGPPKGRTPQRQADPALWVPTRVTVPAFQDGFFHVSALLRHRGPKGGLAHGWQEFQEQLGALSLSSSTFSTVKKKHTFHSQIQDRQSWWPSYPRHRSDL